jgi:hypothetical protein
VTVAEAPDSVNVVLLDQILKVSEPDLEYPVRERLQEALVGSGAWKYPSHVPLEEMTILVGSDTLLAPVRLVKIRLPDEFRMIQEAVAPENTMLPVFVTVPEKSDIFLAMFRSYRHTSETNVIADLEGQFAHRFASSILVASSVKVFPWNVTRIFRFHTNSWSVGMVSKAPTPPN